ncbi:MAG: hypothetical protein KDI13_00700 [Alphaproteobacteria bacterium]|nr:hypothetical protein [Alphaproteobacteria bacterium]
MIIYHPYGRAEASILSQEGLTKPEIADALRLYAKVEKVECHIFLGINRQGAVCASDKNWNPEQPKAFSSLDIIPWHLIHRFHRQPKEKKIKTE